MREQAFGIAFHRVNSKIVCQMRVYYRMKLVILINDSLKGK